MLNSATPDFDLPSTSLVGLLPEEPACYGVIMGMSTVLLEGAVAQWDIHSLSMPQWDVQDDARPSQDRLSSVIHPSGNRKEETHSRDVFPHFPRASERASMRCAGGGGARAPRPAKAKAPCVTNGREGRGKEACRHDGSRAYIVMDKVVMT